MRTSMIFQLLILGIVGVTTTSTIIDGNDGNHYELGAFEFGRRTALDDKLSAAEEAL